MNFMKGRSFSVHKLINGEPEKTFLFSGAFIDWGVREGTTVAILMRSDGVLKMVDVESMKPFIKLHDDMETTVEDPGMYEIFGSEIQFSVMVLTKDIVKVSRNIWDNPDMYSDYKKGSYGAYYHFLKFLWVRSPGGEETQLAKFVQMNVTTGEGEPPK